jgi:hypothetical protein
MEDEWCETKDYRGGSAWGEGRVSRKGLWDHELGEWVVQSVEVQSEVGRHVFGVEDPWTVSIGHVSPNGECHQDFSCYDIEPLPLLTSSCQPPRTVSLDPNWTSS